MTSTCPAGEPPGTLRARRQRQARGRRSLGTALLTSVLLATACSSGRAGEGVDASSPPDADAVSTTDAPPDAVADATDAEASTTVEDDPAATADTGPSDDGSDEDGATDDDQPEQRPERGEPPVDGLLAQGEPWGETVGLLQFRGNPQHTFYGTGPVPEGPEIAWRYPDRPMCSTSVVGGEPREWCGTGWTGQPAVWERPDGVTELAVGTYDRSIHFVDVATGQPTRTPFPTGDLIKGSVTIDPDGFPLLYSGSRDNRFRVIALDRDEPTELFALGPHPQGVWNDDWDGNATIRGDLLFVGGEDSWFRVLRLNRAIGDDGLVTVDPEVLVEVPGFDSELIGRVGRNVSIENSVAVAGDRVYFANSGGRVLGLDVSNVADGEAPIVLDHWVGDDVDASIVVDELGMLYVSVELERFNSRALEQGQLVKLDPTNPDDPYVWGVDVPPIGSGDGGLWSTPALWGDHLYVATHPGELLAVDRRDGEVVWSEDVGFHEWSSPAAVDGMLVVGLCEAGTLRAYSLDDPTSPALAWEVATPNGTCIESTPAVWDGGIYVGNRDGYLYAFRDPS